MTVNVRDFVDMNEARISRRIFVDKEIYEQELERIFARCWCFLAHESQIPNPGDFVASYIGEDPVLVVRDSRGKIGAFLNTCRHRGMRVYRADVGNAAAFTCTYHGWTYGNDGKLVGVPGYKEYYYEELDMEQWGLVPVAQVDSYRGLIFGTFDPATPTLLEFLGDMAWYFDLDLDRREGGTEVIGGTHKWVLPANWKFTVENFIGDSYHFPITHASATRVRNQDLSDRGKGNVIGAGFGHGLMVDYPTGQARQFRGSETYQRYIKEITPELGERLGPVRSQLSYSAGSLFPNFSMLQSRPQIMVFHPRGPEKMEIWAWCLVDKDAPAEVKESLRVNFVRSAGPSGIVEQDDMENWNMCTASSSGTVARRFALNYRLGIGHDSASEDLPGSLGPRVSETNQRYFYRHWLALMSSEDWSQISVAHPVILGEATKNP